MRKNVASQIVDAQLINLTTGAPVTTGSTSVYVSGDGGPQALAGGSPSAFHLGQGVWSYVATAAESNYDHVAFTFVNSAAINVTVQIYTSFPQTGDSFVRLGAPVTSVSADIAAVKAVDDAIKTKTDFLPSATAGAAGGVFIAGSNAATSITTALTANITGNITGNLSGSVGSVTGAVGSVTGLTASDVGSIKTKTDFLPSVTAGANGGVFIAGTNAATTITTALTTTFTGNLTGSVGSVTGLTASNLDTTVSSRATQTSVDTIDDFVDTEVAAIKVVADKLNSMVVSVGSPTDFIFTAAALSLGPTGGTAPTVTQIADEVQTRTIAAVTLVNGLAADSVNASALATDAVTEIQTGLATSASIATLQGFVDTEVAAIKAVTDKLDTTLVSVGSPTDYGFTTAALAAAAVSAPSAAAIADAVFHTTLTEGYAAQGAQFTLEQFAYMLWSLEAERSIVTTTLTAGQLDHSSAMTFTLDSASAPTAQERTT